MKMKDLQLSVIMPVFNQEVFVADAIRSILNQTYEDFEFIIVDDGSTDATVEIVKSFPDPRIVLIEAEHKGYVSALRLATRSARGKWLARMDSDDVCPPDRLEKQLSFLIAHPECVFLTTGYGIVTPNDRYLGILDASGWNYIEPADITHGERQFCDASTMFEREAAISADYDEELGCESPLWYRLLGRGRGAVLREPLYYIRWRMGSLSRGQMTNAGELHYRVRDRYDHGEIAGVTRSAIRKGVSKNEKRTVYFNAVAGDFKTARKTVLAAWRRYPFDLEVFKLMLFAFGLLRMNSVEGPGRSIFHPISQPFNIRSNRTDGRRMTGKMSVPPYDTSDSQFSYEAECEGCQE